MLTPHVNQRSPVAKLLPLLGAALLACAPWTTLAQTVSFSAPRNIPIGPSTCQAPSCFSVVSGDFNGDGKPDLVVGFAGGTLVLMPADGTGGFKPSVGIITFNAGITELLAADINHDGKLDLLVGSGSPAQTYLLWGQGDGTFRSAPQPVASGAPVFFTDINGDGRPDLGTHGGGVCEGQVQLGNGDGTFQSPLCVPFISNLSDNVAVGDFNGDGKPDLAWGIGRSSGGVLIYLGNGDGTFRLAPNFPNGRFAGTVQPLAIGDLNHDGKLDLVVGKGVGLESVIVFFGEGDGSFQAGLALPLNLTPTGQIYSHSIFIADFNGDGKLDIANDNVVILGNGDGTFQPAQYFLAGSDAATSLVATDLNGDGLPDLVFVNYASYPALSANGLSVLLNNTPGPPNSVIAHSAATGIGPVAPSSLASVYGKTLARTTASASGANLPTQLGGISLRLRDVTNTVRLAPLLYVSSTQINFLVPDQIALGPVVITVDDGSSPLVETANATAVTQIAPAIFTVNAQGTAAASAARVLSDGTQQAVPVVNCNSAGLCTAAAIDLKGGHPVYLSLYGTGFRHYPAADLPSLKCQAGSLDATLEFAGAQPTIPGLDQINILLPAALPSGTAAVQCQFAAFGGFPAAASNTVQIAIQ